MTVRGVCAASGCLPGLKRRREAQHLAMLALASSRATGMVLFTGQGLDFKAIQLRHEAGDQLQASEA